MHETDTKPKHTSVWTLLQDYVEDDSPQPGPTSRRRATARTPRREARTRRSDEPSDPTPAP